ncbi:MAG: hypothetical protein JW889_14285 [Verrucomicrobia bacterium]|nr:hypothetical protein [Verrucomicrobiota bacterium]
MSRIVTYETDPGGGIPPAVAGAEDETPILVLGGPAKKALGHLAGSAQRGIVWPGPERSGVAVMSVEASSELVRLTRVIVSALTMGGNGTVAAMIEAMEKEEAKPEKGFSSPLQEAVFLLLLRPRVLRVRPSKRHLGPLMQDLAKRLQVLLRMKVAAPRVIVLTSTNGTAHAEPEADEMESESTSTGQLGPRDIYREVLARVRAALTARTTG